MEIVRRPLEDVVPPAWNVRVNHNVEGIAHSINVHGMKDPIGIWATCDGDPLEPPYQIVEGSGRWYALRDVLHETEVDTIPHDFDSSASARAYALQHNHQGDLSEDDDALLRETLTELDALGRLDDTGYTRTDLEELQLRLDDLDNKELLTDPDDVPEEQDAVISARGDVWILGPHRVMCGDSTSEEDVRALLAGEEPGLMVTDPPYGVDYAGVVAGRRNQRTKPWEEMENDAILPDDLRELVTAAVGWESPRVAIIWHPSGAMQAMFVDAVEGAGWTIRQRLVWVKNALVFGRSDYQWRHEPMFYATREGYSRPTDRTITTVWEVAKTVGAEHPTQKPVELFCMALANHAESLSGVADPFLGSGTALIAAETLGRTCYGMEIEPRYVDVAVRRWINATGGEATRESDGTAFPTGDDA